MTPSAPYEKSKSLGSGGSMVARLKLKGIDGRAPPEVDNKPLFPNNEGFASKSRPSHMVRGSKRLLV